MKKYLLGGILLLIAYLGYVVISLSLLSPVAELKNRKTTMKIQVKDWQGRYHDFLVGPKNRYWTSGGNIPSEMKWSVIVAEDSNFYRHEGVDVKAIKNAIKYDLEKKSFARGASTLTQQLAKNLYLSREKTITRKLKEVYLALRMEQELTKGRIMELYLNVVELGPSVYGIGHASRYYFGKSAADLTPREAAFLAAMLPGPRVAYNPYRNMHKVLKRSDMILGLLRANRVLSEDEYAVAMASSPNIGGLQRKVDESIKTDEVFANRTSAGTAPRDGANAGAGEEKSPAEARPASETVPLMDKVKEEPTTPEETTRK
jgi:monofunctional biosynthetic peptidoglycan transglycosylase